MELRRALEAGELAELTLRWGPPHMEGVTLTVDSPFLTGEHQLLTSNGRRAEICYVMNRGRVDDGVLLHTKSYYPPGVYRLPTGGIHTGETVLGTLEREVYEETGLRLGAAAGEVKLERLLGVLFYDLHHRTLGPREFATYFFLLRMPAGAELAPTDPEEEIAGWQWLPAKELPALAEQLERVRERSAVWGDCFRYRAAGHRFAAQVLQGQ